MNRPNLSRRARQIFAALLAASLLACGRKTAPADPAPSGSPEQTEPSVPAGEETAAETAAPSGTPDLTPPDRNARYLPDENPSPAPFPDDGKLYINYAVNYGPAGKITGGSMKEVTAAGVTAEAKANLGYRFIGWSDGQTDPVRTDTAASLTGNTVITAIFDYDLYDMPVIAINTETGREVQSKRDYINADFRILGASPNYEMRETILIRGRGNNSWGYEKKSYKMKFPEKVNLFGLGTGKDKVWVLLANVCDQSLQRNHVALELARTLDGVAFSPASLSAEVYLNGEYRGVYLLAEEIRDSKARVNINTDGFETETDIGYLVELSSYADGDVFFLGGKSYKIHSDLSSNQKTKTKQIRFITDYMEACMNALKGGNREEIEALMDLPSMIDTYLTEEVVKNLDVGWDSYYLYKEKGGKLYLGPVWDFDLSLGNANEGEEFTDGLFAATRSGSGGGNPWHYRAMEHDWFRKLVVERWDAVKADIIDKIPDSVRAEGAAKLRSYERNFIRWPIFGTTQNRETEFIRRLKTYTEHYEYLADWAAERIAWLDGTYHQPDFLTMRLEKGGTADDGGFVTPEAEKLYNSLTDLTAKAGVKKVRSTVDGFGGEGVDNLFDGEPGTKYCWSCYGETEITFELKKAVTATHIALMTANDTRNYSVRNPQKWKIYGSNDNSAWDLLMDQKDGRNALPASNFTWSVFPLDASGEYPYYKVWIQNDDIVQFSELALLGE